MAHTRLDQTRYERVKALLSAASPNENVQYMGFGKFWELPLEQFKQVSIYGIRMIATEDASAPPPPAPKSCCGHDSDMAGEALPSRETRGERSGLIKGLRGEYPFDGKRFPRLPWGGKPLADADIDFIQHWIDDGCDATETIRDFPLVAETQALQSEDEEPVFAVFELPPEEYASVNGEITQRTNLDFLTPHQLEKLRYAFRQLYQLNKWPADRRNYNNQAMTHQNHCQHAWERFLPWHRIYLYEFEQALQDVCPGVALPYWDWTMPRYKDGSLSGDIIPQSFKAYMTPQSIKDLKARCPNKTCRLQFDMLLPLVGDLFTSQREFFAAVTKIWDAAGLDGPALVAQYRTWFIDVLLEANALWYSLRYPAEYQTSDGKPGTINEVIHYHYPSLDDVIQIQSVNNYRDYGGGSQYNNSYGWIDQNPHNTIHIWTGGMNPDYGNLAMTPGGVADAKGVNIKGRQYHKRADLYGQPQFGDMFSNLTAAFDPIFWPHHVNVDRLWSEWQREHPNAEPSDPAAVLSPWNYTVRDTYDISRFGYEYVRGTCIFPVGLGAAVTRLKTAGAGLPKSVLAAKQVELRLHRVPQLPLSCYIRVFLNQPDAVAETPWRDNPNFAGYISIFGHGACYGGPGHCDLPPSQKRKFDIRDRHHNTPRNHRLDITRCVKKLLEAGASDLQVTLVVVGVNGEALEDLLRLDSVSLNFKD